MRGMIALGAVICSLGAGCDMELSTPKLDLGAPGPDLAGIKPPTAVSGQVTEPDAGASTKGAEEPATDGSPCIGCGGGTADPEQPSQGGGPGEPSLGCTSDADCAGTCVDGSCRSPSCHDDVRNQDETDIDCGGAMCPLCDLGGKCEIAEDCATGACETGACCEPNECGDCSGECCIASCDGRTCGDDGCGGSCGACALGEACSVFGSCVPTPAGCPGGDPPAGPLCNKDAGDFGVAFRVSDLRVPETGKWGHGFDVDDRGYWDCAPVGECGTGVDNALAAIAKQIEDPLQEAYADGTVVLLGELYSAPGEPLGLRFHIGAHTGACDSGGVCSYLSTPLSWECGCSQTTSALTNAAISGNQLTAGGQDDVLVVPLVLAEGVVVTVPLRRAKLRASVSLMGGVSLDAGVMGGAIRKGELVAAIEGCGVPEVGAPLLAVVGSLVPDVDTDWDGIDDACSVGFQLEAERADIIGVGGEP